MILWKKKPNNSLSFTGAQSSTNYTSQTQKVFNTNCQVALVGCEMRKRTLERKHVLEPTLQRSAVLLIHTKARQSELLQASRITLASEWNRSAASVASSRYKNLVLNWINLTNFTVTAVKLKKLLEIESPCTIWSVTENDRRRLTSGIGPMW